MKKPTYILIGILFLALWIRLYQSHRYFPFWLEQADDMVSVRMIWEDIRHGRFAELPLNGQTGTYRWSWMGAGENNPIYHGVFYYYFLLPASVVGNFDPHVVVLFLIGIGVTAVYLLYDAGRLLFDDEQVGLVAAMLGAVSFWLATYSRFIWTPSTIPFFSLLALVAYLYVVKGKNIWWYILAFSLSAGSQVHSSGYVPLFFFLTAILIRRPQLPESRGKKILLLCVFLLPIAPTILYEITSSFTMTKALFAVGGGSHSLVSLKGIGESMGTFFLTSLGFVHINNRFFLPTFGSMIETVRAGGSMVAFLLGLIAIAVSRHKLLWAWWLVFLLVPSLVEFLYVDQQINDYSRMNNLVFALPMLFLGFAWILVALWRRKDIVFRIVAAGLLGMYLFINWTLVSTYLWRQTDQFWGYGELNMLANKFTDYTGARQYNLMVYHYSEGDYTSPRTYELLYLLDLHHKPMPQKFNGVTHWSIYGIPLAAHSAQETMYVIDKDYIDHVHLPEDALRIEETANILVYRSFEVQ